MPANPHISEAAPARPLRIISIPTDKFREQNPIFHEFYAALQAHGVEARDFSIERVLRRDLVAFQVHFPEHFAINHPPLAALVRSAGLVGSLVICKVRNIPVVWTVHNVALFETRNLPLYRLLMGAMSRMVDGCVFLSRSSEQAFHQAFPRSRPRDSALIPHPSYPIAPAPLTQSRPLVLGMIGEQKSYKQPLESLRLYETARRVVDCRLLVAGTVHDPLSFERALGSPARDDVEWINQRLCDDELEQAAKRAHFVLLPYSTITNSGAALYALSCGRAIVTSSLPLFEELRDMFGPAWVRIADGRESESSFWEPPSARDLASLQRKLDEVSLEQTAVKLRTFIEKLGQQTRSRGRQKA